MSRQTNKPAPAPASLQKLFQPHDVTNRGEGIEDLRGSDLWKFADDNFVEGNLEGKYASGEMKK
jgi:hypothetical protein